MNINGVPHRTIWLAQDADGSAIVWTLDQRKMPHFFDFIALKSSAEIIVAIEEMWLRGAPLIGAAAALGFYLATTEIDKNASDWREQITEIAEKIRASRPTAVNLNWAIQRQLSILAKAKNLNEAQNFAQQTALDIVEEDVEICKQIGAHGLSIIEAISNQAPDKIVNILTHCNAGWLACVDWGTATAPIYQAHDKGIKVHVWVDETRPRNQGASLTAWELGKHGVPHTIIPDNAGGHLMQQGRVDMCIVGTDRVTRNGDTANKIGTYLKALAAHDNNVPFYVALPSTTMDFELQTGAEIPIETRSEREVKYIQGLHEGTLKEVLLTPNDSPALNYGFDVTPAKYITAFITEKGICTAAELLKIMND
jgi:methylthioribose-1-phosphate isomerase